MRIAYVCTDPGIPVFGSKGASIHAQEMLRAFAARGAEITLITPRPGGEAPADLAEVRVIEMPPNPKGDPETRARGTLAMNADVAAALADLGPLDLVYERHALYAHAAMEYAAAKAIPSVLEVNAPLLEEETRHRRPGLPEAADDSARRAMAAAGMVSAVSPSVADHARRMGARKIHVIENAVNAARCHVPRPERRPDAPYTLGFLGSLKPWHDLTTLAEAYAQLRAGPVPQARLLIVGEGPARSELERRLADLGVSEGVRFTGALPPDEVAEVLTRMDVGLAPYAAQEDFYFSPLKIYEYMAAGLPVVASRVGHLDEVVAEGRTGRLVPPGDAAGLARVLADLAADPAGARALGAAARADVLAEHTWDRVAEKVLSLAPAANRTAA